MHSIWFLPKPVDIKDLSGLDLPEPILCILFRRGITDIDKAKAFIDPLAPPDAFQHFTDLARACERLRTACLNKERVAICGDYDADGMTSSALLVKLLCDLGALAFPSIPSRGKEGYGLNKRMIEELSTSNTKLIITVDNGINASLEIEYAKSLGIELIITDHHHLSGNKPDVLAILHPHYTPTGSPYKYMAGVGMAFILGNYLIKYMESTNSDEIYTHLFCIGTIADMSPLLGANRYWIKKGLRSFNKTSNNGLKALQEISGISDSEVTSEDIGFKIAPRINSVGRLSEPSLIVDLFLEDDRNKATNLARKCNDFNNKRRIICDGIEEEAKALLASSPDNIQEFILLAQRHWHHGVIGIVASRLQQRFNKPTALLAIDNNSNFRASVRSPNWCDLNKILPQCDDLLLSWGGHSCAAGFTVKAEKILLLEERLNKIVSDLNYDEINYTNIVKPESYISLREIDFELFNSLNSLQPFGNGNPKPIFWTRCCSIDSQSIIKSSHLRLFLKQDDTVVEAIYWNYNSLLNQNQKIDIAFTIVINKWNGISRIQLEIISIRTHQECVKIKKNNRIYICSKKSPNEFCVQNSNGDKIMGNIDKNGYISSNSTIKKNVFINSLLSEASISLGLYY